ncbi:MULTISPECIES: CrcB family protein [Halobacterium]|nr:MULTISPECIES: CrcB family protein [Halobacterium]MDL0121881.1 CrcB family protein [Halobacterium salinarum]MDL0132683.1 CrcB family protein [Halobacterium salinarum]QRY24249.1 CrcB family protein [Halobacterium sp. BOL4-2]
MGIPLRIDARSTALVAVGGAVGAVLRYTVAQVIAGPLGTLAANAAGSLALGALAYEAAATDSALSADAHTLLGTGCLSAFTTYSTFAVQTAGLAPRWMAANVATTYALGFAGVLVGRAIAATARGDRR